YNSQNINNQNQLTTFQNFRIPQIAGQQNKPLTPEQLKMLEENQAIEKFAQGLVDVKDVIAPSAIEVNFSNLIIGRKFFRSYFAVGYPSTVGPNWLEPLINFEFPIDISTF